MVAKLHGTVTGRWAGSKPELQDPNQSRSAAPKDDLLFDADYVEMEERILGMMSADEREAFMRDPYNYGNT